MMDRPREGYDRAAYPRQFGSSRKACTEVFWQGVQAADPGGSGPLQPAWRLGSVVAPRRALLVVVEHVASAAGRGGAGRPVTAA